MCHFFQHTKGKNTERRAKRNNLILTSKKLCEWRTAARRGGPRRVKPSKAGSREQRVQTAAEAAKYVDRSTSQLLLLLSFFSSLFVFIAALDFFFLGEKKIAEGNLALAAFCLFQRLVISFVLLLLERHYAL